jgi:hypothetical protein
MLALLFFWPELQRQVRITGRCIKSFAGHFCQLFLNTATWKSDWRLGIRSERRGAIPRLS